MKTQENRIWNLYYDLLKNFVTREGHSIVPKQHMEKGIALGVWVERQRAYKPTLENTQRDALDAIPGWTWEDRTEKFSLGEISMPNPLGHPFQKNRELEAQAPSPSRPRRRIIVSVDESNRIVQQRQGKPKTVVVIDEPEENLEKRIQTDKWQSHYRLLLKYLNREGHCIVPAHHIENDIKLGLWVQNQRQNKNKMPEERRALLEGLDSWCWDVQHIRWITNYKLLEKFAEQSGHGSVPRTHSQNGIQLGVWVWNQKNKSRQGTLKPERRELLERIPGWTWNQNKAPEGNHAYKGSRTLEEKWQNRYNLLLQFGKREGHYMVPARHVEDGVRLGKWVQIQRKNRKNLAANRYSLLSELDGWAWVGQDARWDLRFTLLKNFVNREAHSRVSKNHVEDGVNIGVWVMHQRDSYRRGELSSERIEALEKLPGWYWPGERDDLSNINIDNLAQEIWTILFGLGPLSDYFASHTAVKKLHESGVLKARAARVGSPVADIVQRSIERGIELGLFDRPKDGFVRAILQKPEYFEDEDWQMCIMSSVTGTPIGRKEAIAAATDFAKEAMGLHVDSPPSAEKIHKALGDAIETAIQKDLLKVAGRGIIQKK